MLQQFCGEKFSSAKKLYDILKIARKKEIHLFGEFFLKRCLKRKRYESEKLIVSFQYGTSHIQHNTKCWGKTYKEKLLIDLVFVDFSVCSFTRVADGLGECSEASDANEIV